MLLRALSTKFGPTSIRYAQYGDVSPKVDVYAFGVVLYELISAKQAVIKTNELCVTESKGLVSLVIFLLFFSSALKRREKKI